MRNESDKVLFAFDFDRYGLLLGRRSLIDVNSDTVVIEELDKELYEHLMSHRGNGDIPTQWTDLMDYSLCQLHERQFTRDDITRVLHSIAVHSDMLEALLLAQRHGADLCIISDANTVYIDEILKANSISDVFVEIVTNPAQYDDRGALRVERLIPKGDKHGCAQPCAENMCKGQILRDIMARRVYRKIVYVGDSTNDFCPTLELQMGDVCLARAGLSLEKLLAERKDSVHAEVVSWSTYGDIRKCFERVLQDPPKTL